MNYPSITLPHELVFNKSAIARLMRLRPSQIINFQVNLSDECLVSTADGLTIFTREQMEEEFHRYRMESGSLLDGAINHIGETHYGDLWAVEGSRGDVYKVEIVDDHYRCTCGDWHQHGTRCKHGWAVHYHQQAIKKLSCHDCGHWQRSRGYCALRAKADLEQLPITHAEVCYFLVVGFEEF